MPLESIIYLGKLRSPNDFAIVSQPEYFGFGYRDDLEGIDEETRAKAQETRQKIIDQCKELLNPGSRIGIVDQEGYLKTRGDPFEGCIRIGTPECKPGQEPSLGFEPIGIGAQYAVFEAYFDEDKLDLTAYRAIWTRIRAYELLEAEGGAIDNIGSYYVKKAEEEITFKLIAREMAALRPEEERDRAAQERYGRRYRDLSEEQLDEVVKQILHGEPVEQLLRGTIEDRLKLEVNNERISEILREKILMSYYAQTVSQNLYGKRFEELNENEKRSVSEQVKAKKIFQNGKCAVKISYQGAGEDKGIVKELHTWGFVDPTVVLMPVTGKSTADRTYIVMDLKKNIMSLKEIRTEMTPYEKIECIRKIGRVAERLWKMGGVHRDIKPSNIMVERVQERLPDGAIVTRYEPYLADFGIMRIYKEDGTIDSTKTFGAGTTQRLAPGSPDFMSPEQAKTPEKVDWRSDLYSLIATAYTWFTGKSANPIEATGNWNEDAVKKAANVGTRPDGDKYKPVDPKRAIEKEDMFNELRRHTGFWDGKIKNIGRWYRTRKDMKNLRLIFTKGMMFFPSNRYQSFEELDQDLVAVLEHRDPPVVCSGLEKKVETRSDGKRVVTPAIKHNDYVWEVFSRFDPAYERAVENPHVQKKLRREKIEKYIMHGIIGATMFALGYNWQTVWEHICGLFK